MAFSKILYKHHTNGAIGSWQIEVIDNHDGTANLNSIATKVLGGNPVVTPRVFTTGKNIGRLNETTPLEQAISEAKSKISKKLDGGYVEDVESASQPARNGLGFAKPMLAQVIDKVKWTFPAVACVKYDGHRLLATVENSQVVMYSRQGKPVNIPHICIKLQALYDSGLWDGTTLDGEAYCHQKTLHEISSLIKKQKPESIQLSYFIYDVVNEHCYRDRYKTLVNMIKESDHPELCLAPYHIVTNQQELDALHASFIGAGYEGTIVRQFGIGYEQGKRSKSLLKQKNFQDKEFTICGYKLGSPKITAQGTFQLPVFKCMTDDGVEFECTAPGDMHQRHAIAQKVDEFVGKPLTVKFFNLTERGAPYLPVALGIREDI